MEPQDFTEKYVILEKVAQGSYGVVYKARNKATKELVAVKKFKSAGKLGLPVSFVREHYLLSTLSGSRLVRLVESFSNHEQPLLVLEWMSLSLEQLISRKVKYPVKYFFREVVKAVAELHGQDVMHRDVKPANVMFAPKGKQVLPQPEGAEMSLQDYEIKLVDFGMAREIEDRSQFTNMVGSLFYRAPELLLGQTHYTPAIDVWALGCIFYLMLTGKLLFQADNELQQFKNIVAVLGLARKDIVSASMLARLQKWEIEDREQDWSAVKLVVNEIELDLLLLMLQLDPDQRSLSQQLLKHPYFE